MAVPRHAGLDVLPAVGLAHAGDGLIGTEQGPGELRRSLADLGGVGAREPVEVAAGGDAARAEVLARAQAKARGAEVNHAPDDGPERLVGGERQPGEQSENEFQGGGRRERDPC